MKNQYVHTNNGHNSYLMNQYDLQKAQESENTGGYQRFQYRSDAELYRKRYSSDDKKGGLSNSMVK